MDVRRRFLSDRFDFVVGDDADDLELGTVGRTRPETAPEAVAARPVPAHESLVDDRDLRGRDVLGRCEVAAAQKRDGQGREVLVVNPRGGDRGAAIVRARLLGKEHGVAVVVDGKRLAHGPRHRRDAGNRPDALTRPFEELSGPLLVVPDQAELGAQGHGPFRAKAHVHGLRVEDAAGKEPGRHQQHERDRRLQDDEPVADRPPASGLGQNGIALQIRNEIDARRPQRWNESGKQSGRTGDAGREQQDAGVDVEAQ